jgi:hypothetical protein
MGTPMGSNPGEREGVAALLRNGYPRSALLEPEEALEPGGSLSVPIGGAGDRYRGF